MNSFCCNHQARQRQYGYKEIFVSLCVISAGIVICSYTFKSMFYNHDSTSSLRPEYVKETIRNPRAHEQAVSETTETPSPRKDPLRDLSEYMRKQVEFIRDAIEKAHHFDLPLADDPKCTGNRKEGEVEDLLCIPKPKFIKEVRNPCWWEGKDNNSTLHCLPYFHILGCEKCGSSDLWNRITSHPHTVRITGILEKEANWWGWARYGRLHIVDKPVQNFVPDYTNHFNSLAGKVEKSLKDGGTDHKTLVTGDGTPSDISDFRGWVNITQNRGRKLPHVITPMLMKHVYPETTKFIVIMRDPIERLYSDYWYVTGGKKSAEGFHSNLLLAVDLMANCTKEHSLHACFFDNGMYRRFVLRFHLILFSLYIKEWLKVFPRERFLFLKTEDYEGDIAGTINTCHEFLGLEPMDRVELGYVVGKPHFREGTAKKDGGPMLSKTKEIIEEIIRPSTHFLVDYIKDERFMWDFDLTPTVEG